jgi:outer membrane lipoprotein SlyB
MKTAQEMARFATCTFAIAAVIGVSGCANSYSQQSRDGEYSHRRESHAQATVYGSIESIQLIQANRQSSGAGAVVGAVIGGLLGNQVGAGNGRTAATVAGAVGGAVVGNQIERQSDQRDFYEIVVRLDDGGYQTVQQDSAIDLRSGDRVHIQYGRVYRY